VALFLLHHRHQARECGAAFASFKGEASPLRHRSALTSCSDGGHGIWWTVEAADESAALDLLPYFIEKRTTATRVAEVDIPELKRSTEIRPGEPGPKGKP
jgi:hypothetical protein